MASDEFVNDSATIPVRFSAGVPMHPRHVEPFGDDEAELRAKLAAAEADRDKYQQMYHITIGRFAEMNAEASTKLAEARDAARWLHSKQSFEIDIQEADISWPWLKEVGNE